MDATCAESQLAAQLTIGIAIKSPQCSVGVVLPRGLLNVFQRGRRAARKDAAGAWQQEEWHGWTEELCWGCHVVQGRVFADSSPECRETQHMSFLIATCFEVSSKFGHLGRKHPLLLHFPFVTFIYSLWFAPGQAFEGTARLRWGLCSHRFTIYVLGNVPSPSTSSKAI